MKANGINQAPPSIRDAPTASRPRKKKTSPEPPPTSPTSPARKRKYTKSEETVIDTIKTKREDKKPKVEKGASTKSDPEFSSSNSNGPNNYPWYNDVTSQQTYESQTGGDTTALDYFRDPGFEHTCSGFNEAQSLDIKGPMLKTEKETSRAMPNRLDGNTVALDPTKYPYLEVREDPNGYVSPWELDLNTKYPYLSNTKNRTSYESPYGPVETDMIMPTDTSTSAHSSAFNLDHCTNDYLESGSSVDGKDIRPKKEEKEKEMGSILIAD